MQSEQQLDVVRFLTKSRFKLACECPTKLYYTRKEKYPSSKEGNPFLMALAEGGYQVGELAKLYYPDDHDVESLDYEESLQETAELLKRDEVTIFEAAIRYKTLFIRIDVLVKKGNHFDLIEVKSKSIGDSADPDEGFIGKQGKIRPAWRPYLEDVAFQRHVLANAYPEAKITASLMLADKNSACPVSGLNQKFRVGFDEEGRKCVEPHGVTKEDLSVPILKTVDVEEICRMIYAEQTTVEGESLNYSDWIDYLAAHYAADKKILAKPSKMCRDCEFNFVPETEARRSGFRECWRKTFGWKDGDFDEPSVLEVWNYRHKDQCINEGILKMSELTEDDIVPEPTFDYLKGLTGRQRQWMQIEKVQTNDDNYWLDTDGLRAAMSEWKYPLHMIDFETSRVAIPFHKGHRPYHGIAFQFSHHTIDENGVVEHAGEYLNADPGVFPNYDFVRALKAELEGDDGSIFRYSPHENSFLNEIRVQLVESAEPDRYELIEFIESITQISGVPEGERNMIDLWVLVKKFYYDPRTKGSNSIKYVLPAILNRSKFVQEKYGKPVYGAPGGIKSLNYPGDRWIEWEDGEVIDPYKLLEKKIQRIVEIPTAAQPEALAITDGGAAMTAYAALQFVDMKAQERKLKEKALLCYCELDTLAMVMIVEGWRDLMGLVP
jgi:hypothetical protein